MADSAPFGMAGAAGAAAAAGGDGSGSVLGAVLAWACALWYVSIWGVCLLGLSVARRYYLPPVPASPLSYASEGAPEADVPGLTIIRPLAGLDCNLFANLCSAFEQHYPLDKLEVLMSVRDAHDQALRVAEEVRARYPRVASRIVVGDEDAGINPKINNLVRPFALAKFDLLWVLDSQVALPPGAAGRAVQAMLRPAPRPAPALLRRRAHGSGRVGLVHHVPLGVKATRAWGSQIERAFLSTTHAKMYLAINALAIDSCVMGKSNLYRRSDLAQVPDDFFNVGADGSRGEAGAIGSRAFASSASSSSSRDEETGRPPSPSIIKTVARPLARFGIYLAEDNMLALSLWRPPLSLAHAVAAGDVAATAVGDIATLRAYAERRMRWIRVRKHMVAAATYAEPLTESIVAGLLGLHAVRYLALPPALLASAGAARAAAALFLAAHFLAWHLVDRAVLYALSGGNPLPKDEQLIFTCAWVMRELLALPIWLWAVLGSTVNWRGQRYRILSSGRAAKATARHRPPGADAEQAPILEER